MVSAIAWPVTTWLNPLNLWGVCVSTSTMTHPTRCSMSSTCIYKYFSLASIQTIAVVFFVCFCHIKIACTCFDRRMLVKLKSIPLPWHSHSPSLSLFCSKSCEQVKKRVKWQWPENIHKRMLVVENERELKIQSQLAGCWFGWNKSLV